MCIYTVTKGTNGDNVPKCLLEEMGTNLPLSITRGLSPVPLSPCLPYRIGDKERATSPEMGLREIDYFS